MKQCLLILSVSLVLLLPNDFSSAQETRPTSPSENSSNQIEDQSPDAKMMREMFSRVAQYVTMAMDSHLDYLGKPSTTLKLAKFQKNYFDALVAQGFTEEQAIRIISSSANPLVGFQTPFPPK